MSNIRGHCIDTALPKHAAPAWNDPTKMPGAGSQAGNIDDWFDSAEAAIIQG
jgi:hypothetical protein